MGKDFSNIKNNRVYDVIRTGTAQEAPIAQEAQEIQEKITAKSRKTYTQEETQEALESMQTSGKKGLRAARMNMAFSPTNYEYIQIMSRINGENLTQFVNRVIAQHLEDNRELFEKALEIKELEQWQITKKK